MRSYVINLIAVVLLFVLMNVGTRTGLLGRYQTGVLMVIFINIILAISLNLTTGFLGQIALGHAGFMSIGAYTAALFVKYIQETVGITLAQKGNVSPAGTGFFLLSLLLAGLVAALFGLLVGIPALRLKGDYLAIITLGFGEIIRTMIEFFSFTGGAQGLNRIPKTATLNVVYIIMVVCVMVMFAFVRSRHGRAIMAIREDDIASEASGIFKTVCAKKSAPKKATAKARPPAASANSIAPLKMRRAFRYSRTANLAATSLETASGRL